MFDELPYQPNRWRLSQAGSLALHVAAGAVLLALPAVRLTKPPGRNLEAIYVPLTPPPTPPPPARPRLSAPLPQSMPAIRPLVLPVLVPQPQKASVDAPKIAAAETALPPMPAVAPPAVPLPPRPAIQTGVFAVFAAAPAATAKPRLAVEASAFAGAAPPAPKGATAVSTRVGTFDGADAAVTRTSPRGAVRTGGFGQADAAAATGRGSRSVAASGFEAAAAQPVARTAARPAVQAAAFGDAAVQPVAAVRRAAPAEVFSGVEILAKPRPAYSDEARLLKLEGEVLVEVLFTAAGEARVLRVLRGLGHGLDENALAAAAGIRFRPARRGNQPVDAQSIVRIVFQLAY